MKSSNVLPLGGLGGGGVVYFTRWLGLATATPRANNTKRKYASGSILWGSAVSRSSRNDVQTYFKIAWSFEKIIGIMKIMILYIR